MDAFEGQGARRNRRGFTLIEVLVVVAIIALLVSILLPSLRAARERTKIVACRANLHDFGIAVNQYTIDNKAYYPLVPYIGSTIYYDEPVSDDNLYVLYMRRYTPSVNSFTCPATRHKVRVPLKVVKSRKENRFRYDIYCDPASPFARNDFEFHGQLIQQKVQDPSDSLVDVKGFGTSYEYNGWHSDSKVKTRLDWYPFRKTGADYAIVTGEPKTTQNVKQPSADLMMKDADEGKNPKTAFDLTTTRQVAGAPPGLATNNIPEPWDNHGQDWNNVMYADGSSISRPLSYWLKIHPR
jgi:prepilin-type N-terminal cleavage/methylation domain-containing protein